MTVSSAAFCAKLAAIPAEKGRLIDGIGDLKDLFRDLIRAYAPPNVQFERERIITQASNPREIVFVLGLLSEGENEAALLLELICIVVAREPAAKIGHLVDEAWYYLRTSIDETWQLDDGPPSASAALAYLFTILSRRLDILHALPPAELLAARKLPACAALLRSLRNEMRETASAP